MDTDTPWDVVDVGINFDILFNIFILIYLYIVYIPLTYKIKYNDKLII